MYTTYYILTLLTVFIIVYLINEKYKIIEGYDARFSDINMVSCADFCKTHSNCYGFGYDKVNKICYPSETSLGGYPKDSIFKKEYSENNVVCNKFKVIQNANDAPTFSDRRMNAIYICRETPTDNPKYYYHNKGTLNDIGNGKMIDKIIDVEDYKVLPYTWPHDKFDYNQNDLLLQMLSKQNILPSNVTNAESIDSYKAPILIHHVGTKKTNGKNVTFLEKDDANLGEYLMDYKCIKNYDKNSCMDACANNNNCNGFEFNPLYGKDKDVCCLYHTVGQYVKRSDDKKNGKFYEKSIENKL
jgi:hypothetical protein